MHGTFAPYERREESPGPGLLMKAGLAALHLAKDATRTLRSGFFGLHVTGDLWFVTPSTKVPQGKGCHGLGRAVIPPQGDVHRSCEPGCPCLLDVRLSCKFEAAVSPSGVLLCELMHHGCGCSRSPWQGQSCRGTLQAHMPKTFHQHVFDAQRRHKEGALMLVHLGEKVIHSWQVE